MSEYSALISFHKRAAAIGQQPAQSLVQCAVIAVLGLMTVCSDSSAGPDDSLQ